MNVGGAAGRHDVDRAVREMLEEQRIAQMGGQILLGFLLAVAYTPVIERADDAQRTLYAWALVVTTAAVVLLLATAPLHRLNFGRRVRPSILAVGHVLSLAGLVALGASIVLSVRLAAMFALPDAVGVLTAAACLLIMGAWLVVPALVWVASTPATGGPSMPEDDDPEVRSRSGEVRRAVGSAH